MSGDAWGDLVGVRGSVQGAHASDVRASPNCLQSGVPGPVPCHEAFRGAPGVMEAEDAGREILAASVARRTACLQRELLLGVEPMRQPPVLFPYSPWGRGGEDPE